MAAKTQLILGPARSGKTDALLHEYRRAIAAGPVVAALWLAPTERAVTHVRQALTSPSLTACLAPQCLTFGRFAALALAASDRPMRPLDRLGQREILRELTQTALSSGDLPYFAPIAGTPGFLDLLVRFIRELKRLEIWPDAFAQAAVLRTKPMRLKPRRASANNKLAELAILYARYQDTLNRCQLYDAEGRFWSARALLRDGQRRPFEALREVYVDGFSDFTRTEHEILEILAGRVERLVISLVDESAPRRAELFAKTAQTRAELARRHAGLEVVELPRLASARWPAQAYLEANLFRLPEAGGSGGREPALPSDRAPALERVELRPAASARGEIAAIAARVKQLLTRGEPPLATSRARPGEILVLFRSLDGAAELAREVFADFGIPTAIEAQQPLARSGLLSALTALLRLVQDNWSYRTLLAVLANTYLQPAWAEASHPAARELAANLTRGLQVSRGKQTLLSEAARAVQQARRALDSQSASADSSASGSERAWRQASIGREYLERLADSLATLPDRATVSGWSEAIERLALDTGLLTPATSESHRRLIGDLNASADSSAWNEAKRLLAGVARLGDWLGQPERERDFAEFWTLWQDILRSPAPESRDETGRVRILSVASARGLSAPYVFLADLGEHSFPQPAADRSLVSDVETATLIDAGLPLASRADHGRDEMLLFYEAVTRPNQALFLSYAALDAKAQPLVPSPYIYELQQIWGDGWPSAPPPLDLSPTPQRPAPLSARDLRLMAVSRAQGRPEAPEIHPDGADSKAIAGAPGQGGLELLPELLRQGALGGNVAHGLTAISQRQTRDRFGAYEGLLLGEAAQQKLAAQFGPEARWSASQLDEYVACPYEFFLNRILRLAPLVERELVADPLARGTLLHDTLAGLHRQWNHHGGGPTLLGGQPQDEALAAALQLLDEACSRSGDATAVGEALGEIDRRWLRQALGRYLTQQLQYEIKSTKQSAGLRPAHFEVSFGGAAERIAADGAGADETAAPASVVDPLSTDQPFRFDCGDETVLLRGRIDRIDLAAAGDSLLFNVVDYKSGGRGRLSAKAVENGQALQLPLYVLAVAELLLADRQMAPLQAGYWFLKESGYASALTCYEWAGGVLQPTAKWQALRQQLAERVLATVRGVRRGEFPVFSADEHCTSGCAYRTVCRVHQVRSLDKQWPSPAAGLGGGPREAGS